MNNQQAFQEFLNQIHNISLSRAEGTEIQTQLKNIQEALSRLGNSSPRFDDTQSESNGGFVDPNQYHQQISKILDILQKQAQRIQTQEDRLTRLERLMMELVTGRTWRTLQLAGAFVKKLSSYKNAWKAKPTPPAGNFADTKCHFHCETPVPEDTRPRSGVIEVKGWAVSKETIDRIEIEPEGFPAVSATLGIARPDIKKAYPALDRTGQSGFYLKLDTSGLPNGRIPISLRLISNNLVIGEVQTSVLIDHQRGYASDYDQWIKESEEPDEAFIQLKLLSMRIKPLISIVMPVYNPSPSDLNRAIESVMKQSYVNWELCIADDCSERSEIRSILSRYAAADSRVKIRFQDERGGISIASNAALDLASGEFICFLDHDDELSSHALAHVADAINKNPRADLFYSDEDKINREGKRYEPFFKPDWSPDLLLSENYICHLLVLHRDLLKKVGNFAPECDGSQDYDFVLRASEHSSQIVHIPKVLYHWRAGQDSTAASLDNKPYALAAAQRALEKYCQRHIPGATVEPGRIPGRLRVRYPILNPPTVSIIIGSGGKTEILKTNLTSVFANTNYQRYEVVVIDNSQKDEIAKLVSQFQSADRPLRYIDWRNRPFNYSAINNTAARQCESPILLFLNDDTSVIRPDWLTSMVELMIRPEVGAVGAKLLYPDGRIQHGGVVMGLFDNCGHAFKGLLGNRSHYFDFSDVIRNVSAVTGACLMTRAEVFWEVGGFDQERLAVAFNDIDLCLKIGSRGYRVLYTPYAELYHYEAFSKTPKDLIPHPMEVAEMQSKWKDVISKDPYYSPHLTRTEEDYSLRISR